MTVDVLVPWRPGCSHRERALAWVRHHYAEGGYTVRLGVAGEGAWCKADAIGMALGHSEAELVVVADADVWTDDLRKAIDAVEAGVPWAIPHRDVHRLTEAATSEVLAGAAWVGAETLQVPYKGIPGGGIVVAAREVIEAVPPDPRFTGWGQEDECWAMALETLVGPPWRGDAPLVHLWHPPQDRYTRRRGSPANWNLRCRYRVAREDPAAMRELLEESRVDHRIAEPTLHDHA